MQSAGKIIALVIVAAVALSVLSSAVNNVHVVPVFGQGSADSNGTGPPSDEISQGSLSRVENDLGTLTDEQMNNTLMILYGTPRTPYMRTAAMTTYSDGVWTSDPSGTQQFSDEVQLTPTDQGGPIEQSIVSVSPVKALTGGMPVFKDMEYLRCRASFAYSAEYGTFSTSQRITDSYSCIFDVVDYNRTILNGATAPHDERYLAVPNDIASDLANIATFVTNGSTTPYAKAVALRDYIRAGYTYDAKYDPAPAGQDPVLWFLLHGKKGVCTQFNSAMTLLARSAGIPARYVIGFVIDSTASYQSIRLAHAHAYCEIELDGIGWVIVDAAPLSFTQPFQVDTEPYWKEDVVTSAEPANESLARIAGWVSQPYNAYYNAPVPGLELGLYNGTELVRVAETDSSGNFQFDKLEWGDYVLRPFLADRWIAIGDGELNLTCQAYTFHVVHFSIEPNPDLPHGEYTTTQIWESVFSLEQRTGFNVTGTVRNSTGEAQDGMSVEAIMVDPSLPDSRAVCGLGMVANGSFDICCMVPDGFPTGHYSLIAAALGNATRAPSEASAEAYVFDDTDLVLSAPRRMPQGVQVELHATLTEKRSGTPVKDVEISLDGGDQTSLTDDDGNVTFNVTSKQTGDRNVTVSFGGGEYLGSSTVSVTFEVLALQAEILTDTFVRGETNLVVGRVYAVDIPGAGVNVTMGPLVPGDNSSSNVSNYFGFFFVIKDIPKEGIDRGPLEVHVSLGDFGEASWTVRVKDRPKLALSAIGGSADASLASPSSEPIPGAQLLLSAGNVTLLAMTDSRGNVEVGIPEESETVRISFEGNADYTNAVAEAQVMPAGFDWSPVLIAIGTACAVGAGGGFAYSRYRARRLAEGTEDEVVEDIYGPYAIEFPQIERGFPVKWGIGEQLRVAVEDEKGSVMLLVDGTEAPSVATGPSRREAVLLLPPGTHEIAASGPEGCSMRILRIVDYREEVARLYQQAVEALSASAPGLTPDHTPREVQRSAVVRMPDCCSEALDVAVSRFEIAGFSDHPFGRGDYLEMEVAVEAVKAWCEIRGTSG